MANLKPTQSLEPTDRTLDHPSNPSKAAAVIGASSSNDRLDAQQAKVLSDRLTVIAPICIDDVGLLSRPSWLAANLREVFDRREYLFVVAGVRRGGVDHERHAVGINQQRVFRSEFSAVNRARPRRIPSAESTHHNAVDHRQFRFEDAQHAHGHPFLGLPGDPSPCRERPPYDSPDEATALAGMRGRRPTVRPRTPALMGR